MTTAVYPGSFDPVTLGHIDIIKRSLACFDELVVAPASTSKTRFSLRQRLDMLAQALSGIERVKVKPIEGLLVDFASQNQATVLIRGLRTMTDFDYEMSMAFMNQKLHDSIQTVFIPASADNAGISSSLVKEILDNGGDVSPFVPYEVMPQLQGDG